jgi:large subunit ribosomal protein L23
VNTTVVKGKNKRFGRNLGRRSDLKKAYVALKEGFDIDFTGAAE